MLFFFFTTSTIAQPYLKPSIGIGSLPSDNNPICNIPVFQGNYSTSGYSVGDTIPDFTLYTLSGTAVNMATVLQSKKPVLLVAGSYTCPVYRGKIADLNAMASFYAGLLNIYIVYTVEAHPTDPSPYSGTVWVTSQNQSSGILFAQPTTYGLRKAVADTMLNKMSITPQVLIDGPCNEWWSNFGPAPNNAYLIDTNGIVKAKQGWYNKLPDNMWCSIDSLLGTNSGNCSQVPANGNFSFRLLQDSITYGPAGAVLEIHCMLKNTSATSGATVNIQKMQKNLPSGWLTALCTDICLGTNVDATQVIIPPADSQSFTFYFYTDSIAGSGDVEVGFANPNNSNNRKRQRFYGNTWSLSAGSLIYKEDYLSVYPNPASGFFNVSSALNNPVQSIEIFDLSGRLVKHVSELGKAEVAISLENMRRGIYYIRVHSAKATTTGKLAVD